MRSIFVTRGAALGGALTLLCASTADAAGSAGSGESTPLNLGSTAATHAASGGGSSILRTIIALVVVIAIIYAVARILRAVKNKDAVRATGNGLQQVSTLPLPPGRSLSLVRSGSDLVLIGVAEQGVTAIKTYTEAEALAAGIELPADDEEDFPAAERPMDRLIDGLRRLTVRS